MKVVCMIPVYRELDNCRIVLPELQKVLNCLDVSYDILFVIAGNDGTREYILSYPGANVSYIYEGDTPRGLGCAYNIGYKKALDLGADVVVSMDGDGNHNPILLKKMLVLVQEGADIVVGSRYIVGGGYADNVDLPTYKVILSRWVNVVLSWILQIDIIDKSSGYRCVRREFVEKIIDEWHPVGFSHQVYLLWLWSFFGAHIVEIPQCHRKRSYGKSTFPVRATLREYLLLVYRIRKRRRL